MNSLALRNPLVPTSFRNTFRNGLSKFLFIGFTISHAIFSCRKFLMTEDSQIGPVFQMMHMVWSNIISRTVKCNAQECTKKGLSCE